MDRPPTWRSSFIRAGLAAIFVAIVFVFVLGNSVQQALTLAAVALVIYVPLGYAFDTLVYRWRQRRQGSGLAPATPKADAGTRKRKRSVRRERSGDES